MLCSSLGRLLEIEGCALKVDQKCRLMVYLLAQGQTPIGEGRVQSFPEYRHDRQSGKGLLSPSVCSAQGESHFTVHGGHGWGACLPAVIWNILVTQGDREGFTWGYSVILSAQSQHALRRSRIQHREESFPWMARTPCHLFCMSKRFLWQGNGTPFCWGSELRTHEEMIWAEWTLQLVL
jgi:hypothetical protein